jgi:hypothetical protein
MYSTCADGVRDRPLLMQCTGLVLERDGRFGVLALSKNFGDKRFRVGG